MASNELYYIRCRTKLGLPHEVRFQKGSELLSLSLCHSTPPICTSSLVVDTAEKKLGIRIGHIYASGLVLRILVAHRLAQAAAGKEPAVACSARLCCALVV